MTLYLIFQSKRKKKIVLRAGFEPATYGFQCTSTVHRSTSWAIEGCWAHCYPGAHLNQIPFPPGHGTEEISSASLNSIQPGLDTLQEDADKRKFFDELERGHETPLDYSQLNRELGETGKSSLDAMRWIVDRIKYVM